MAKKKDELYDYDVLARNFATMQAKKYDSDITRDSFDWSDEENNGLGSVSLNGKKLFNLDKIDENSNGWANADDIRTAIQNYYKPSMPQMDTKISAKPPTNQKKSQQNDYGSKIDIMLNNLMKSRISDYDPEDDPLFQAYKEQYSVAGDNAMKNTMSAATGITGGRLNSWATSAGQQAKSSFDKKLMAQIPALANADYSKQQAERQNQITALQTLLQMDDRNYSRSRDSIMDDRYADEIAYSKSRDLKSDQRYDDEFAYKMSRDDISDEKWKSEFDAKEIQNAIANEQRNKQLSISGMNAGTAANNSNLANQKFLYSQGQDAIKNDQWERKFAYDVEKTANAIASSDGSDVAQMYSFMMNSNDPKAWLIDRASTGAMSDSEFKELAKYLPKDEAMEALKELLLQ